MNSFSRIFRYVWPQWPRIVSVVLTSFMQAVLFSLSFATIVPLLKVMMGEEGLHGWVDRSVCKWQYGMDFYIPDKADFTSGDEQNIAYYLLVTDIKEAGLAKAAGLAEGDRIIGAGRFLVGGDIEHISAPQILEELARTAQPESIKVQFRKFGSLGSLAETNLSIPGRQSRKDQFRWKAVQTAEWAVSFLPRNQAKSNKTRAVVFIIVVMMGVTVFRCAARFHQSYLAEKIVQVSMSRLREDLFDHIMHIPVGFFSNKGTSDTTSRMLNDISIAGKGIKILLGKTLREPLTAMGTLTLAMMINWKLTLIFMTAGPPTLVMIGLLGRKIKKATKKSLMSSAVMLGRIQEAMGALGVVKVYNRQDYETSLYRNANQTYLRRQLRSVKIEAATNPIMEVLGMFAGSAALLVGVGWVADAQMQSSSFFGLLLLLGSSAESIRKVSDVWNDVQQSNAAAERVFAIMDTPLEEERPDAVELKPLRNKIEFQNIVFTYPGSDRPVLRKLNLTVKAGQTVAVVGPNGSGKTTLVNLIPRFYEVDSGAVLIDGQDIRQGTLRSLRDQISMVTQNVVTFNDTIAANIGYGKPDATRRQIIEASMRAYCHEFIEPLEKGYDTFIGEHGSGFSGGQLQRIVIARAVLKNPAILIFDEAMSQVDAESEAKIHKALSELMQNRTCFVIAHRFSTVISADSIVVMDKGNIIAKGTHDELVKNCPLYRGLYETQLMVPDA